LDGASFGLSPFKRTLGEDLSACVPPIVDAPVLVLWTLLESTLFLLAGLDPDPS
jgi:hypothetical protein